MRRTIRLTERDLSRLVRRVINEQDDNLPTCDSKMVMGNGIGSVSEMSGSYTKITYNGSGSPKYQGYTVHSKFGPFCFIKS